MRALPGEYAHLRAYIQASRELYDWISGARALALLNGADECGLLDALWDTGTLAELSAATGMDENSLGDLCLALEAHGVIQRAGNRYEFSPAYALLAAPDAAIPLANLIRQTMVILRTIQSAGSPAASYTALSPAEVLAMAEGAGISTLSVAPHVSQASVGQIVPEVAARWEAGAHHLEVGCGIGNSLLGIALTFPKVTAVGIEIDEQTVAEAERRIGLLDLADRVELRWMDACDLQDEGCYETIQWSQFFFPAASRPAVLEAMRRALKPGGYLLMPWMGAAAAETRSRRREMLGMTWRALRSGDSSFISFLMDFLGDTTANRQKERQYAAEQRLIFSQWGVPMLSEAELAVEAAESGFEVVRSMCTPVSQFVLTRGFLLVRRGSDPSPRPN